MTTDKAFGYLRGNRLRLLTVGVSVSLLLNVVLLVAWVMFALRVGGAVDAVDAALEQAIVDVVEMQDSSIEVLVDLDQAIEVSADIPINQMFTVHVDTDFQITEELTTTINVRGPLGAAVPITITVPIDLTVPILTDVEIPINEVVSIDIVVPLATSVPVEFVVGDSAISDFLDGLEQSLIELRASLKAN